MVNNIHTVSLKPAHSYYMKPHHCSWLFSKVKEILPSINVRHHIRTVPLDNGEDYGEDYREQTYMFNINEPDLALLKLALENFDTWFNVNASEKEMYV